MKPNSHADSCTTVLVIPRAGDAKTLRHAYRIGRLVAGYGGVVRVRFPVEEGDVFLRRTDLAEVSRPSLAEALW